MKIDTALILCAGFGKRVNPLTLKIPKPLLRLNNLTLLENTINLIKKLQIKKIKLNTFYLEDQIKNFIKKKNFNIDIEIISDGNEILDTGGGIANMIKSLKEDNFLVFNPDTLWSFNYSEIITKMQNYYFSEKLQSLLLVVNKDLSFDESLKGDFFLKNNKLNKKKINNYLFTGCQIINKKLFTPFEDKKFSIVKIWSELIIKDQLFGYECKNKFYHVTDLEIYKKLLKN